MQERKDKGTPTPDVGVTTEILEMVGVEDVGERTGSGWGWRDLTVLRVGLGGPDEGVPHPVA